MHRIALVDLGMGNLRSVQRALEQAATDAGASIAVSITAEAEEIARADKVVVPGQGAFRDCAAALAGALGEAIRERIAQGTPYLGICLGLQALFQRSEEAPGAEGLGVFAGEVQRLAEGTIDPTTGERVKIPHMGWNEVEILRAEGALSAFADERAYFYFVHSYHAVPADPALVAAVTHHGPLRITAAVQRDNVLATQFHPEKSQEAGLRLLGAFLR
ncbi:MAG: imidazole glycerol phosphate synthase subunit HisH [Minicystis sp.]